MKNYTYYPSEIKQIFKSSARLRLESSALDEMFRTLVRLYNQNDGSIDGASFSVNNEALESAGLAFRGHTAIAKIPLDLLMTSKILPESVKLEGKINIVLASRFYINELNELRTETQLQKFLWVKRPELKLLNLKLNVNKIVDSILRKRQADIESMIDDMFSNANLLAGLRDKIKGILNFEFLLSSNLPLYINLVPEILALGPAKSNKQYNVFQLMMEGQVLLSTSKPAPETNNEDIKFALRDESSGDAIGRGIIDLTYPHLGLLIQDFINSQNIRFRDKIINAESVNCSYLGDQIEIKTIINQAINGTVILKCRPRLEMENQEIIIHDLQLEFQTKNWVYKTLSILFKRFILKKLEKYSLISSLFIQKELQSRIFNKLNKIQSDSGIHAAVILKNLSISRLQLNEERIESSFDYNLNMRVDIQKPQELIKMMS